MNAGRIAACALVIAAGVAVTACGTSVSDDDTKEMDFETHDPKTPTDKYYGTVDSTKGFTLLRKGDVDARLDTKFAADPNKLQAHVEYDTNPVRVAMNWKSDKFDIDIERDAS